MKRHLAEFRLNVQYPYVGLPYVENHEREKTENLKGSKRFLEQDTSLNALTQTDINQLWLPFIIYANTDQKVNLILSIKCKKSLSLSSRWKLLGEHQAGYSMGMGDNSNYLKATNKRNLW